MAKPRRKRNSNRARDHMNAKGIEKISHRKALMKAGRKALAVMGDV